MMSDTIDDALDNDEAEDETEELTNQVWFLLVGPDAEIKVLSSANPVR